MPALQLHCYGDWDAQMLPLSDDLVDLTLICPGSFEVQPLWLRPRLLARYPDACQLLVVADDLTWMLDVGGEANAQLETAADASMSATLEEADMTLRVAEDAYDKMDAEEIADYGDVLLSLGEAATQELEVGDEATRELEVDGEADETVEVGGEAARELEIGEDASVTIDVGACDELGSEYDPDEEDA